jgi:predicted nucleotidyltransferase
MTFLIVTLKRIEAPTRPPLINKLARKYDLMSSKPLRIILEKTAKLFFEKHKFEIIDILLFGSLEKGKDLPKDIDILLIFKKKKSFEQAQELRNNIKQETSLTVEITPKVYDELFQSSFLAREAILTEGYSLINKISFAEGLGYKRAVLFIYQLKGKNSSERMRFYYSLYGRTTEGMLKKLEAVKYTDTVILCPVHNMEKMKEYLNSWNIEYTATPLLIPSRLF